MGSNTDAAPRPLEAVVLRERMETAEIQARDLWFKLSHLKRIFAADPACAEAREAIERALTFAADASYALTEACDKASRGMAHAFADELPGIVVDRKK